MRIRVLRMAREPLSFQNYREHVCSALASLGVDLLSAMPGAPGDLCAGADLLWDPGVGMGRLPAALFRARGPLVVTVHGLRAFSLPLAEIASRPLERAQMALARWRRRREWRRLLPRVSRIIAVSRYGAGEVERAFGVEPGRVRAIHHGVDHALFRPEGEREAFARPYFLHVSSYQPKKNVARILAAHAALDPAARPGLRLVVPGHPEVARAPDVLLVREPLPAAALARLYRGARAFLFPSLHETFGMPILEAMACGCPVLTSPQTGCGEVADDAAYRVDPRSSGALAAALERLASDDRLCADLAQRGIARAAAFRWERCAEQHLQLFDELLRARR